MLKPRSTIPAAILAAALVMTVAACGSGTTDPLHGLSSSQIATKALADTKTASIVKLSGHVLSGGQGVGVDLSIAKGKGCTGTMSLAKTGSLQLVSDGSTFWFKPDDAFWKSEGATDPALLAQLTGKYIKAKASDAAMSSFVSLCSISTLMGSIGSASTGTGKVTPTTFQGQRAVKITNPYDSVSYAYVSDTAKPLLLNITKPGSSGGAMNFSYPAKPPVITPPPASEVIDGSKYGF